MKKVSMKTILSVKIKKKITFESTRNNNNKSKMSTPISTQNTFTFQIKNPGSTKNKINNNMVAMKRIQNYSYALNDEIGLGFTSHVYKGKCQITNKQVAVKVIELKNSEDQLHANFLKEEVAVLQTIKNADSRNLLKLEKVIKSKNNLYIITEFCEGNDIAKILRKKKLFSEVEAQSIMKQVLNGYKQLYQLQIVHRDLKLANFFITKGQVKIADFGFAISESQSRNKIDYNVGSPYYMPPESLRHNQYSYLSDVWAFGVIAYQLVYGRVPWKDRDDQVLYQMIMSTPIDMLFDADKEVSDHYKKFIRACLVVDKRFRATPQFITNYPWPFAQQYVEGLEDQNPNAFRYSVGGKGSLPRISVQKPQMKKIISENTQIMRRRTPSVDNLITLVKKEENIPLYTPFPPPRVQTIISKSFVQQKNQLSREKGSKVQIKSNNSITQQNSPQKSIVAQINFCRFMAELIKILKKYIGQNNQANKIRNQLTQKISDKMRILVRIAQNQQNLLKLEGFSAYLNSERWQGLRQVIYKYDMKFREELSYNNSSMSKKDDNTDIIEMIRELKKNNLKQFCRVAELLTYYYQLKQEDSKAEYEKFAERTKISYLVDQCKQYLFEGQVHLKNHNQLAEREERLLKKLSIIGI